ncbi:MAG: hypothetical protein QG560_75 [Campylobacterota bacterium]|nr:hypothetical protein [Campylobacterota bacterium]
MKIDILSDLHFDFYFPQDQKPDIGAVKSIFDPIFFMNKTRETGDTLVIAGDIGHSNAQNIEILKIFQKEYYKHIVCVLGNHDYYLIGETQEKQYKRDSFKRVGEMRNLINSQENMYCLNGSVVEIEGVRFGGCDSSYSNAYMLAYYKHLNHPKYNNDLWKQSMYDAKAMFGIDRYNDLYKIELPKMEAVYKECDIMITHVNPSYLHRHMAASYKGNHTNMFFTFDGHRFMQEGSMKYWIFGHTHDRLEYEHTGVKCICNPLGYPSESYYGDDTVIKSINLNI